MFRLNYNGNKLEILSIISFFIGIAIYIFISDKIVNTFEVIFVGFTIILLIAISSIFFRKESRQLAGNLGLLTPLGYLIFFNSIARLFLDINIVTKLISFSVINARLFSSPLSNSEFFSLFYIFSSSVIYTLWTLQIILQIIAGENANSHSALKMVLKHWWKTAIVMIIGYGVLIIFTPVVFIITEGFYSSFLLLSALCILWNVITAFSLIIVLDFESNFFEKLKYSFELAWQRKATLLFPISLHTFLLGTITVFPILSNNGEVNFGNSIEGNGWVWSINGVWNGALSNSFNWYVTFLRGFELEGNLFLILIISIIFSIFAIIIKLKIGNIYFKGKIRFLSFKD